MVRLVVSKVIEFKFIFQIIYNSMCVITEQANCFEKANSSRGFHQNKSNRSSYYTHTFI